MPWEIQSPPCTTWLVHSFGYTAFTSDAFAYTLTQTPYGPPKKEKVSREPMNYRRLSAFPPHEMKINQLQITHQLSTINSLTHFLLSNHEKMSKAILKSFLLFIIYASLSFTSAAAYSFVNKKAIVTGSSGGIGSGIAKELARKGARVLIHYNERYEGAKDTKAYILENGGTCDGIIQCDFTKPSNICDMMNVIDDVWDGEIDILVNNAGIVTKLAAEDEDDDVSSWMDTIQVNLNAPYQLSTLAHKRMKEQENGGVIINVSSIHGSISVEYMTAYAASKAAMDRMTAGLSNEWAKDKVRMNAVAPGIVPVERTQKILETKEAQDMWLPHLPAGTKYLKKKWVNPFVVEFFILLFHCRTRAIVDLQTKLFQVYHSNFTCNSTNLYLYLYFLLPRNCR